MISRWESRTANPATTSVRSAVIGTFSARRVLKAIGLLFGLVLARRVSLGEQLVKHAGVCIRVRTCGAVQLVRVRSGTRQLRATIGSTGSDLFWKEKGPSPRWRRTRRTLLVLVSEAEFCVFKGCSRARPGIEPSKPNQLIKSIKEPSE